MKTLVDKVKEGVKAAKKAAVVGAVSLGIGAALFGGEARGATVIESFMDLIPVVVPFNVASMIMDYTPQVDNLMIRNPITGTDSIVSNVGLWHFGGFKITAEGIVFGAEFDNHTNGVVNEPPYVGFLYGRAYKHIFPAGDTIDGILCVYDDDGEGFALNYSNGTLVFDDNVVVYWTEDIEFDGIQGDIGSFGAITYTDDVRIPHMVINPVTAREPFPPDGDEDIDLNVELRWTGAYGSVHNVYFGTDPNNLPEVSFEQAESVFDVEGLEWATAYYWRVDEVDSEDVVHPGRLWTFDTINDCSSSIAGDVNGDCVVDFKDFAMMAENWLQCTRLGTDACP